MSVARRAAVNVDVDGLYLYDRIHGHAGGSGNADDFDPSRADATAWTKGVTRFLDLFDRSGVKGTFFVVAQDLANPDVQKVLAECVASGHEIGSHSLTHPYNLSRMSPDAIAAEVRQAREILQDATGQPINGFRAPGYVMSPALADAVAEAGHQYDSSLFPCPPYQAAKASIIGLYRLLGRPSGSIPEGPGVWFSERTPHVMTTESGRRLMELPIGVLPGVRMPFIGTSLIAFGELGWQAYRPILKQTQWINFECHAIDLTDHQADQIPARLKTQPDQRVPLSKKWPLFLRALESLSQSHEVATLEQWSAREFAPQ